MKNSIHFAGAAHLQKAALISLVLLLPFATLELLNRQGMPEDFPIALFAALWLLGLAFVALLMSLFRNGQTQGDTPNRRALLLRGMGLLLVAALWTSIVADQMPCFLGVPNCD